MYLKCSKTSAEKGHGFFVVFTEMIDAQLKPFKRKDGTRIVVRDYQEFIRLLDHLQLLNDKFQIVKAGAYLRYQCDAYPYYVVLRDLNESELALLKDILSSL